MNLVPRSPLPCLVTYSTPGANMPSLSKAHSRPQPQSPKHSIVWQPVVHPIILFHSTRVPLPHQEGRGECYLCFQSFQLLSEGYEVPSNTLESLCPSIIQSYVKELEADYSPQFPGLVASFQCPECGPMVRQFHCVFSECVIV